MVTLCWCHIQRVKRTISFITTDEVEERVDTVGNLDEDESSSAGDLKDESSSAGDSEDESGSAGDLEDESSSAGDSEDKSSSARDSEVPMYHWTSVGNSGHVCLEDESSSAGDSETDPRVQQEVGDIVKVECLAL